MDAKAFAAILNGNQYTDEITEQQEAIAKENGLVVAFGGSDDLLELRGAIHDEFGAYNGTEIWFVKSKFVDGHDLATLEAYGVKPDRSIKAIWCPDGLDTSWLIETADGAPFDIYEGDELYCRGVVFKL